MTVIKLTPQQAADRVNVSRGTIMNAIKDKSLIALRDNRNRWQISYDNLSDWVAGRTDNDSDKLGKIDSEKSLHIDEKVLRIAMLEAEVKAKDQRISDLQQERDARLADKDKQIAEIRKDRDEQIVRIKVDFDKWFERSQRLHRRRRPKWWPF